MENENNSLDGNLQRPDSNLQNQASLGPTSGSGFGHRRISPFGFDRLAFAITTVAVLVVLSISALTYFLINTSHNKPTDDTPKADKYSVSSLPTGTVQSGSQLQIGNVEKLAINGQLQVSKGLVISPSDTPDKPSTGQIYYDKATNTPYYYNGSKFIPLSTTIQGISGSVNVGGGISLINSTLVNSGVISIQGQTGAVNFASGSGIAINGSTINNTGVLGISGNPNQLAITSGSDGNVQVSIIGIQDGGVLVGRTGGGIDTVLPTSGGQCLISNPTTQQPEFGSCTGQTTVTSINVGSSVLTNAVTLQAGSNIGLSESGGTVTIAYTGPIGGDVKFGTNHASGFITMLDSNGDLVQSPIANQTGGLQVLGANYYVDVANAGTSTLTIKNSTGSNVANLTVTGVVQANGGIKDANGNLYSFDTTPTGTTRTLCYVDNNVASNCPAGGNLSSSGTKTQDALTKFDAGGNIVSSNLKTTNSALQVTASAYDLDIFNSGANSVVNIKNSDGTGKASLVVEGSISTTTGFLQGTDLYTLPASVTGGGTLCYVTAGNATNCPTGGNVSYGTTTNGFVTYKDGSGTLSTTDLAFSSGQLQATAASYTLDFKNNSGASTLNVTNSGTGAVANLAVSGSVTATGGLKARTLTDNTIAGAGNDLAITSNNNNIVFSINGGNDTFTFITGNGTGQKICTDKTAGCATGVGAAVILEPGTSSTSTAQVASNSRTAIFINKTAGTGNILQLQASGSDALVVNNLGAVNIPLASGLALGTSGSVNGKLSFARSGASAGTISLQSAAGTASYALTLPLAAPTGNQCLTTDSSGQLSFSTCLSGSGGNGVTNINDGTTNASGAVLFKSTDGSVLFTVGANSVDFKVPAGATGVTTVGTLDTPTKSADGAHISGSTLYLQTADASSVGLVSTTGQTFSGDKTFANNVAVQGGNLTIGNGATTGSLILVSAGSGQSVTISAANRANALALSIPGALGSETTDTICLQTRANCASTGSNFISNGTGLQSTANFHIQSSAVSSPTAVLTALTSQTAKLLELRAANDSTVVASFDVTGNLNAAGGTFTGSVGAVNGTFSGNVGAVNGSFSGTLGATGNTTLGGTLGVTGTSSFTGAVTLGNGATAGTLKVVTVGSGQTITITGANRSNALALSIPGALGSETTDEICLKTAANCTSNGSGGSNFINNSTSLQNPGNFHIQSTATSSATAILTAKTSQTANLLELRAANDSTVVASFDTTGNLTAVGGTFTGNVGAVNGTFSGNVGAVNGSFSGTLGATGNTSLGGTLGVTGAATLNSTLAVTGTSTLTGAVTFGGGATPGTLKVVSAGSGQTITITAVNRANALALSIPGALGSETTDEICLKTAANCTSNGSGGSNFINNGTGLQTPANFHIQSSAVGSVTAVLTAKTSQTANLLELRSANDSTVVASFDTSGNLTAAGGTFSGNVGAVNGSFSGTLGATGNTSLGGTLGVTGAASLSSTLSVQGTSTLTGATTLGNGATAGTLKIVSAGSGQTLTITALNRANALALSIPGALGSETTDEFCLKTAANCTSNGSGSSNFINNSTGLQSTANFHIQSSAVSSPTAVLTALTSQTAKLLELRAANDSTVVASFDVTGNLSAVGGTFTGNVGAVNGSFSGTLGATGATTLGSTLSVQGTSTLTGALTLGNGANAGSLAIVSAGSGQTITITAVNRANALALSIPGALGSETTDTICLQTRANCSGSANTLQSTYTASTGSTTPEIILDTTRNGIDIQNNNTTPVSGSLFAVRDKASSGLGTALFSVADTGATNIQTTTNSQVAFQIQNAASSSILTADTINNVITLNGSSAETSAWTTSANALPVARKNAASVTANGYVYVIGGNNGTSAQATVFYAKLNSDGSVGSWNCQGANSTVCGATPINGNALPASRDTESAVYSNGYIYVLGGSSLNTVYYARVNTDGSTGAWTTSANSLPLNRNLASAFVANGYIYMIGGEDESTAARDTVFFSRINPDGSNGSWLCQGSGSTASDCGMTPLNANKIPGIRTAAAGVTANGYAYIVGGYSGSAQSTVYYAKLNSNGTTNAWTTASGTPLPNTRYLETAVVVNGVLYVTAGNNGTSAQTTTYYASLNTNTGALGSWSTSTNNLPSSANRQNATTITANGYIYVLGGTDGSTTQSTVYYASASRVVVGGSLDLVGGDGNNLADGGTGGSLTAGNTTILGTLQVQGAANFTQDMSISGNLSVGGQVAFKNVSDSTAAFQVQNSSGSALLTADTTNMRLRVGSIGTATGQLYVSGTAPSLVGTLGSLTGAQAVMVQGRYAYIAGLSVVYGVDVETPSSPALAANSTPGSISSIFVSGKYVYVAGSNKLYIYDASKPNLYTLLSTTTLNFATSGSTKNIYVQGRYLYVAIGNGGTNQIAAYDISNPAQPSYLGAVSTTGQAAGIVAQGKYLYAAEYDLTPSTYIQIFDISNPAGMTSVGSLLLGSAGSGAGIGISVQGRYAYVAGGAGGLRIVDVNNPSAPSLKSSYTTGIANAYDVKVQGRYAYIIDPNNSTLQAVDISSPSAPVAAGGSVSTGSLPFSLDVQGRYAYVANRSSATLQVFDLGGAYIQQLETGGIETGTLSTRGNATIYGDATVQGGLNVSTGLQVAGNSSFSGSVNVTSVTNSTTAFQVQDAGSNSLLTADTTNFGVSVGVLGLTGSFGVKSDLATGTTPNGLVSADFNGDGRADVAVGNGGGSTLSVFHNSGTALALNASPTAGTWPSQVATGDFNGDGKMDVIATNFSGTPNVGVYTNSGSAIPNAASYTLNATGGTPYGVATGDFNGDGKTDAVVVVAGTTGYVYINTGSALPATATYTLTTVSGSYGVNTGDFNGDGKTDVIVLNGATASIYLNTGSALSPSVSTTLTGLNAPYYAAVADFNGDGKADLLIPNSSGTTASIFINTGSGYNTTATSTVTGLAAPRGVVAADFNNDGKMDAAITNSSSTGANGITILMNTGTGLPTSSSNTLATGNGPTSVIAPDINGDNKADLVVTNGTSNTISTFINNTPFSTFRVNGSTTLQSSSAVALQLQNGSGVSLLSADTVNMALTVGGTATVKTTSTSAFSVQTAAGSSILNVDTTNLRVSVGSKGTATGQLYVSGNTPSGALAGANGAGASYGLAIQGRYAYTTPTTATNGFQVYDVSNPASPSLIKSVNTTVGAGINKKVKVQGKYAYVAGGGTLEVFNISNPMLPASVGTVTYTGSNTPSLYVQGRYAYVGDSGTQTFNVFDVSSPASPTLAGSLTIGTTSNGAADIYVQGRYAYIVTAGTNRLQIIDLTNPASPSLASSVTNTTISTTPTSVVVQGRYAYVGTTVGSVYVIDISDPSTPVLGTSVSLGGGSTHSLAAQGRYLYAGDATNGLIRTIDISTPVSASLLSGTTAAVSPLALVANGRYAYVANNNSTNTLQVFDFGGAYTQQLEAGGIEADTLSVRGNSNFASDVAIQGSLGVGTGLQVAGNSGFSGAVGIQTNNANALQVKNASGSSVVNVDTSNSVFSANSVFSSVGTIAASFGTVTGTGTQFTAGMVGGTIYYNDGTSDRITSYSSSTSIATANSKTVTAGSSYSIYFGGLRTLSNGSTTIQTSTNSTSAFQVQNASATSLLTVDTTSNNLITNSTFDNNINGWSVTAFNSGTIAFTGSGQTGGGLQGTLGNGSGYDFATTTLNAPTTIGQSYTLTYYAKKNSASNAGLTIAFGGVNCPATTLTTSFVLYTCTKTATSASTSFSIQDSLGAGATSVVIDSIYLIPTGSTLSVGSIIAGTTIRGVNGSGTNGAGSALVLSGGQGTGNAAGGDITLQIAQPGSTGASVNQSTTVFSLSGTNGAATFKNATDSTTAFQIQNSSAQSLFNVDTTSNLVTVGSSTNGATAPWTSQVSNLLPQARAWHATATYNGYIYVLGGGNNGTLKNTVFYAKVNSDGSTGAWKCQATTSVDCGGLTPTNSNVMPAARSDEAAVAYGGYLYVFGSEGSGAANDVYNNVWVAKLSADGSTGAWIDRTGTSGLPVAMADTGAVVYNGYVYLAGGLPASGSGLPDAWYAKLGPNGTLGSWSTASGWIGGGGQNKRELGLVAANGYLYALAGDNGSTNLNIYYGRIDPTNGSITSSTTASTSLPVGALAGTVFLNNGYLYVVGFYNSGGGNGKIVQFAKLNSDGSVGTWSCQGASSGVCGGLTPVNNNTLPSERSAVGNTGVVINGYMYIPGGATGSGIVGSTSIYYASGQRLQVNASLDLVGGYAGTEGDGGASSGSSGGSLTAGNTRILGTLDVQSSVNFAQDATIAGNLNLGADLAVAGNASITGTLTVTGTATFNGGIVIGAGGHIVISGGSAPTGVGGSGSGGQGSLGSTGNCSLITGNDTAGTVRLIVGGTGTNNGDICRVTFSSAFGGTPRVLISPVDRVSAGLDPYAYGEDNQHFWIGAAAGLLNGTYYINYFVVQ